jgi:DNA-binding transcriptional MerR regulator
MLDRDLAELYEVETKVLKRAVRRNMDIFPGNFMFELNEDEFTNLRSQFVTSSWGGHRYLPFVFTEHGILQLANVIRSLRARKMSIRIIEVFIKMREMLSTHKEIFQKLEQLEKKEIEQDKKILLIFKYLKYLEKIKHKELKRKPPVILGYSKDKNPKSSFT